MNLRLHFCSLILCLSALLSAESRAAAKPNIVFILMDDLGWTDPGCYGSDFYQTPNIDRLAREGVKFTHAYAAAPVCSPTRASILTGKYPARLNLTDFIPGRALLPDQPLRRPDFLKQLPLEERTIAEALQPLGYVAGAFGKWHLGGKDFGPDRQGFKATFLGSAQGGENGEPGKGDHAITEAALNFIESHKHTNFFAYIAFNTPHIPLAAPTRLVEQYETKLKPTSTHTNATYAAMMEVGDALVGRILDRLESLGLATNTLVVFTSDNGGLHVREWKGSVKATRNDPLRAGKGYLYEGGIRVPLIARWPGMISAGGVNTNAVSSVDYFPTFVSLAGGEISTNDLIDGTSLTSTLTDNKPLAARELYWHYPHYPNQGSAPGGAIRDGDFKLIQFFESGVCELYNLQDDPGETENLAASMQPKVGQLLGKLDLWRRTVDAEMMLPNPDWNPETVRAVPSE